MNLIKASLLKPGISLLEVDPNGAVAFIGEGTIGLYRVLVKNIPLKLKDMCFKRQVQMSALPLRGCKAVDGLLDFFEPLFFNL